MKGANNYGRLNGVQRNLTMRNVPCALEKRSVVVQTRTVVSGVQLNSLMSAVPQLGGHFTPPSTHLHLHLDSCYQNCFIFSKENASTRISRQGHGSSLPVLHKLIKACFFWGFFLMLLRHLSLYVLGSNLASS